MAFSSTLLKVSDDVGGFTAPSGPVTTEAKSTVPAKPLRLVRVMMEVEGGEDPARMVREAGLASMLKLGP